MTQQLGQQSVPYTADLVIIQDSCKHNIQQCGAIIAFVTDTGNVFSRVICERSLAGPLGVCSNL